MTVQQGFVGQQAMGHSLGVVQPVDRDEGEFRAGPDPLHVVAERRVVGHRGNVLSVHAHGEDAESDGPILHRHQVDLGRKAEQQEQGGGEVPHIPGGVEPDEVGAEETPQQVFPVRQGAEDFLGGKRDMEEEADPGLGQPFPHHGGNQHELVIVHPDLVAFPILLRDRVGEAAVDFVVHRPVPGPVGHLAGQIVEHRPDEFVGEPVVIAG